MATKKPKTNQEPKTKWGKTLTPAELIKLLAKLEAKKKEQEMSKLSDSIKAALEKKKGVHHLENDSTATKDTKKKVKPAAPAVKKPTTRAAGRGR